MKFIIKDDETIEKAHNEFRKFTQDEEMRDQYEARMKWKSDYNTMLYEAEMKGIDKGILEGRNALKIETAKNMLAKGYHIPEISDITGLSVQEIEELG